MNNIIYISELRNIAVAHYKRLIHDLEETPIMDDFEAGESSGAKKGYNEAMQLIFGFNNWKDTIKIHD